MLRERTPWIRDGLNIKYTHGDVQFKEDAELLAHIDLTTLANIIDIFVYDTTRDDDGGAWTCDANAQASSWYNETLNTATRGATKAGPKKLVLIAVASNIYLVDAKENSMWMRGDQATGYALSVDADNNPSSIYGLNGNIYVGLNGGSAIGAVVFSFKTDQIWKYNTSGRSFFKDTIDGRNTNAGY